LVSVDFGGAAEIHSSATNLPRRLHLVENPYGTDREPDLFIDISSVLSHATVNFHLGGRQWPLQEKRS
ncbi:hypothetical protein GOODEAATRI_005890, partial [Goodea atripinnis]